MSQPTEYEQAGYNAPDGLQIGRASTDKLGFYGTAPQSRVSISTAISTTASISTSGVYGFASSTEALQVVGAVSTMAYLLKTLGLAGDSNA